MRKESMLHDAASGKVKKQSTTPANERYVADPVCSIVSDVHEEGPVETTTMLLAHLMSSTICT